MFNQPTDLFISFTPSCEFAGDVLLIDLDDKITKPIPLKRVSHYALWLDFKVNREYLLKVSYVIYGDGGLLKVLEYSYLP